jgi:hypothetical protein
MSRFDYVHFDEEAQHKQNTLKSLYFELERALGNLLPAGRATSLAITHLEESFMWVGKSLRDEQIAVTTYQPVKDGEA